MTYKDALNMQLWIDLFGKENLNLDELQKYFDFINKVKKAFSVNEYNEWHHIVPKCLDKKLVYDDCKLKLLYQDHVIAHILLSNSFVKGTVYKRQLASACLLIIQDPRHIRPQLSQDIIDEAHLIYKEGIVGTHLSEQGRKHLSETLSDGRLKGENHPCYGTHLSEEAKLKISKKNKAKWTSEKRAEFSKRRQGIGNPCYGKKLPKRKPANEETRNKMSESGKGKIWIHKENKCTKVNSIDEIPEGWSLGRTHFTRSTNGQEGRIWINNGKICKKIPKEESLPDGFVKGRLWKKKNEN